MNINPTTGIRYGVIAGNSLDPDLYNELWYGPARNLSEEEAAAELRKEIGQRWDDMEDTQRAELPVDTREEYIEYAFERECENIQINEPEVEGEHKGVKYRISWLGGAPLVWIVEGPLGYANRLCSPCVPNAADLDSGFIPGNSDVPKQTLTEGYLCYVTPADWLAKE